MSQLLFAIMFPQTKIHPSAPSIFMGSMAIIAGALGVFLPETRGKNMPDTVAEATRSTSDADRVMLVPADYTLIVTYMYVN